MGVNLYQAPNEENLEEILCNHRFVLLFDHFQRYLLYLRSDAGRLAQFWMSYIDMVEILLDLIRSSRKGNWILHLKFVNS